MRAWLLYPSLVMAGSAVGWSISTDLLLGLPHDPLIHLLVFALALLFYNRDRLTDAQGLDDQRNMAERTAWVQTHQRPLQLLVRAAALVSLGVLALRPAALPPILAGLGFALAYNVRCLPGKRAFKQLPGVKAPYVAVLWVLLVVGAPLSVAGGPWDWPAALVALAFFALVAAQVIINDIRDIEGDRLVGTQTLAVLWGEQGARWAGVGMALLTVTSALLLPSLGLLIAAFYTLGYATSYRRAADPTFRWIIESAGIVTFLAILGIR